MKKIVLTGGGSAGHIMPHVALLEPLKKHFNELHYIGSGGIEKSIMTAYPEISFHEIDAPKLRRSLTLKNLAVPFRLLMSVCRAKKLLRDIAPNVIFSKGGFVSLPVISAAAALDIPSVLHESDATFGLANRLSVKNAAKVLTSFAEAAALRPPYIHTGTPIRPSLYGGTRAAGLKESGLSGVKPVILIIGGSLGARALNETVRAALPEITARYDLIHICGRGNTVTTSQRGYFQLEFALEPSDIYAAADIVISRAGSNAIAEFAALKKPMLLIPLPAAASRGDQLVNAEIFRRNGWARVLPQEKLTPQALPQAIESLYRERGTLVSALTTAPSFDGTDRVLAEILSSFPNTT
ncbi:MAG: UDP-N-acetylglucosamine--N-acetylmuramyl-(pentapeptide) pyrophosphoryl-undecaprenol N-acetylglucosamine transferase [Clostridiales bacterium]|jgi:UDP-N-acetylglucosamine--N-acetylmuramyl-(pentapeptide) pyrophosphoryl-undecaprenol N-acetylglucosamine transferase|nr:UDP-N-acetylglucosamine--N-acetylmuramyl-(pentapeptide) pyrophosphoryl-undecaprenol N-acetylglucosamine transferase [Clostridiales bacterium]